MSDVNAIPANLTKSPGDAPSEAATAGTHTSGRGFIAGTMIHTREGLAPIERINVGDLVLTQPESSGAQTYKRVTQTFRHENQEIWRMEIYSARELAHARAEKRTMPLSDCSYLLGTPNQSLWVMGKGWMHWGPLRDLRYLERDIPKLEMANGELAIEIDIHPLAQTTEDGVAWHMYLPDDCSGMTIDLRDGKSGEFDHGISPPVAALYWGDDQYSPEPYRATVYSFDVEEHHSYYAGTRGIWVKGANRANADDHERQLSTEPA